MVNLTKSVLCTYCCKTNQCILHRRRRNNTRPLLSMTTALVRQVKHKCNNYNTAYKDLNEGGRRRIAAGRITPKVPRCDEYFFQLDG